MKKEQYSSCYLTANNNPISSRMLSIIMTVHVSSHQFHNHQQVEERRNHHLVDQVLPREIVRRREVVETKVVNPLLNIDNGVTRSKPVSSKLSQRRRRHRLLGPHEHHVDEEEQQKHKHTPPPSSCQESYKLYKICSTRYDAPTGFNCSSSVATYMKCALSQITFVSLINLEMEFVKIIITDLFVTLIWVTVVSILVFL